MARVHRAGEAGERAHGPEAVCQVSGLGVARLGGPAQRQRRRDEAMLVAASEERDETAQLGFGFGEAGPKARRVARFSSMSAGRSFMAHLRATPLPRCGALELNRFAAVCYGCCTDRSGCPELQRGVADALSGKLAGLNAVDRAAYGKQQGPVRTAFGRCGERADMTPQSNRRSQLVGGLWCRQGFTTCPAALVGSHRTGWSRPPASCRSCCGHRRAGNVR